MIVLALVETAVLVTVGSREQRATHEVGIARTWRNCNETLVPTVARVNASVRTEKNLRVERSRWSVAEHGPFRQHNDHSCLRILQLTMRARRANVTWCALTWRRRLCRQVRGSKQPDLLPPHTFVIPLVRRFFVRFFGGLIHCVVREAGCAKPCRIHDAERVVLRSSAFACSLPVRLEGLYVDHCFSMCCAFESVGRPASNTTVHALFSLPSTESRRIHHLTQGRWLTDSASLSVFG